MPPDKNRANAATIKRENLLHWRHPLRGGTEKPSHKALTRSHSKILCSLNQYGSPAIQFNQTLHIDLYRTHQSNLLCKIQKIKPEFKIFRNTGRERLHSQRFRRKFRESWQMGEEAREPGLSSCAWAKNFGYEI